MHLTVNEEFSKCQELRKKVTSKDKSNNSNRKQVVNDSSNNTRIKPSEMTDAYLMSQIIGFFNANSKKSINAAGWESFRKIKIVKQLESALINW